MIPTLLGLMILQEKTTTKKVLGISLSVFSIVLLAFSGSSGKWPGISSSNLPYFMGTFFGWGFAYFLHGLASKSGDFGMLIIFAVAGQTIGTYCLILLRFGELDFTDFALGHFLTFVSGLVGILGELGFFLLSKEGEEASLVVPLTGTYVLIPTVLGLLFLNESLSFLKLSGIMVSVVALAVLGSASADK